MSIDFSELAEDRHADQTPSTKQVKEKSHYSCHWDYFPQGTRTFIAVIILTPLKEKECSSPTNTTITK